MVLQGSETLKVVTHIWFHYGLGLAVISTLAQSKDADAQSTTTQECLPLMAAFNG